MLKNMGNTNFLISILSSNKINEYWNNKQYVYCFYLLAMTDYISRISGVPLCTNFDYIRNHKLNEILYPTEILLCAKLYDDKSILQDYFNSSIPEFKRFNIAESEVDNNG